MHSSHRLLSHLVAHKSSSGQEWNRLKTAPSRAEIAGCKWREMAEVGNAVRLRAAMFYTSVLRASSNRESARSRWYQILGFGATVCRLIQVNILEERLVGWPCLSAHGPPRFDGVTKWGGD